MKQTTPIAHKIGNHSLLKPAVPQTAPIPAELSISGTLEAALGCMTSAENELSALYGKLLGPGPEGRAFPATTCVEEQARMLSVRLAYLIGGLATINEKV
jgi:hypothetical protein